MSSTIPERVHLIGIEGIGVSALARYLLAHGHRVSGSDRSPGEQSQSLAELGAQIHADHAPEHVYGAELVVMTNAVGEENAEVAEARRLGIPLSLREELLGSIVNAGRGVAIAGTHGKTWTTALVSHIAVHAGLDPTALIGGVSANLGSNARIGHSDLIIAEADEYKAAFLHLRPRLAVITNVEPEHLDFYKTPERVYETFRAFAGQVGETLIACADDPTAASLWEGLGIEVVTYGLTTGDWLVGEVRLEGEITRFRLCGPESREFEMHLTAPHNVINAAAAILVGRSLGVSDGVTAEALRTFRGVARRAEIKGQADGVLVLDDYGHHPTEIRTTLDALRRRFGRPMRVLFQPHTYSRTRAFLPQFATAFDTAEAVYLLDIYGHREVDTLGISTADLAGAAAEHHPNVVYTGTHDRTLDAILLDARPGDLVVTMGAGDVYRLGPHILAGLEERCRAIP